MNNLLGTLGSFSIINLIIINIIVKPSFTFLFILLLFLNQYENFMSSYGNSLRFDSIFVKVGPDITSMHLRELKVILDFHCCIKYNEEKYSGAL